MDVALVLAATTAVTATLAASEQPQVPDGAPDDAAQHVAPGLVGWDHAVGDQHHRRPDVVGDHPERHVAAGVAAILLVGQLRRAV